MSVRRKTVMVVDALGDSRERLATPLKRDYKVLRAASGESALALMEREEVDLLISDLQLPGVTGLELLQIVKANYPLAESILVADGSDLDGAVQAIKLGAYHFLGKDSDPETLRATVAHASERQDLNRRLITLRDQVQDIGDREFVVGPSRAMQDVIEVVNKVGPLSATVLILGESGTGKELFARMIHRASTDAGQVPDRPFIAVNLAAIPRDLVESTLFGHERGAFTGAIAQQRGRLEMADRGTVFLDEIGELAPPLQAKLLRVLQDQIVERIGSRRGIKIDVRVIAATNCNLEEAMARGTFRKDLYFRLNVVTLTIPPLRERRDDVPLLAAYFVRRHAARCQRAVKGISPAGRALLARYDWPGNVRELSNAIERAIVLGSSDVIMPDDLPESLHEAACDAEELTGYHAQVASSKREIIRETLERNGGNVAKAARALDLQPTYLHRLIRNLGLRSESTREEPTR